MNGGSLGEVLGDLLRQLLAVVLDECTPRGLAFIPDSMVDAISIATALLLLAIAGLHVYWGLGGRWPGYDAASLNAIVVGGRPGSPMPSSLSTVAVAAGIVGIALGALAVRGLIALPLPGAVRVLTWLAATILALRGLAGFFEKWLRPHTAALPYGRLNRRIYSPLCVALAAGLTASLTG